MATSKTVSVIISCFNEEKCIDRCIRDVAAAMPAAEIVVVHGGKDRTLQIAKSLQSEFPQIVAVYNENDRGKGHGVKTGIANASGEVMAQFDADMQFFATDLPALVQPLLSGECDVCLGSRFLPVSDRAAYKPSLFRDLGNRVLAGYVSTLIRKKVTDVTAGVKSWTRAAITEIDFRDDKYTYEAEIVLRAGLLGLRLKEIPVAYASRHEGQSMHANNLAVIKAGTVIILKCLGYWARTVFGSKRKRSGS
jgi:glycosyltransferase involved in cell wall biosynthesis